MKDNELLHRQPIHRIDIAVLVGLLLISVAYVAVVIDWSVYPAEDAAMLMRYAQHAADGHGIVWNIGEEPVDGATDFLFLIMVAAVAKLGFAVESAVRILCVGSHVAAAILVFVGARFLLGANRWLAALSAAYLIAGPGLDYIETYFGTPVFALIVLLSFLLALRLARGDSTRGHDIAFALSSLVTGLIRPEGVLMAAFLLVGVIWVRGWRESRRTLVTFASIFIVIGGAYFLWRWQYFGQPLPNPFYKKGGGQLYPLSLKESVWNLIWLALPFWPVFVSILWSRRARRIAIFGLIPAVGFALIWVLLSNEMNYLMRFQYATLPIVLVMWPALLDDSWKRLKYFELLRAKPWSRTVVPLATIGAFVCVLGLQVGRGYGHHDHHPDGRYDVARLLSEYSSEQYTLAVSEAGLLPFYSTWRSIDTWGLNDKWIARNGGITQAYLDGNRPEVIMYNAYFSPVVPEPPSGGTPQYNEMISLLDRYAQDRNYILAAAFGAHNRRAHYYWVRADFPHAQEIIERIRGTNYTWYRSGETAIDFAAGYENSVD